MYSGSGLKTADDQKLLRYGLEVCPNSSTRLNGCDLIRLA
jgi:hypothetical protein